MAQERVHWYNSDNWELRESSNLVPEQRKGSPRPPAVPDSELVPCPTDEAVFKDTRFRVDTDGLTTIVHVLQIEDKVLRGAGVLKRETVATVC